MTSWLFLDCNNLCHRAFHSTGHLKHNEILVGVIFGFLRDVVSLRDLHQCDNVAFCFDSRHSNRKKIFPGYKDREDEDMSEEDRKARMELYRQITLLRREYLPEMGFKNILCQRGFEADDMIAVACEQLSIDDDAIIVSTDKDLWQLLRNHVRIWNPIKHKILSRDRFMNEWGVDPVRWSEIKAMAGCTSDTIPGIKGVGEKTAAKWIRGEVKQGSAVHDKILAGMKRVTRNLRLIRIPFEGYKPITLHNDKVSEKAWKSLTEKMGFKTLRNKAPTKRSKRVKTKLQGFRYD
jgi:DNA polymerase-1